MHKADVCAPHTTHCLADGNIMISTMGDANEKAKGSRPVLKVKPHCLIIIIPKSKNPGGKTVLQILTKNDNTTYTLLSNAK